MAKVLGLVMARNEPQLISISISHALKNFCDQIIVLVHDSSPEFEKEVSQLTGIWPNKIIVLKLQQKDYQQKKAMRIVSFIASKLDFDWIYPIDADEFGLTSDPSYFKKFLDKLDSKIIAVRYSIENWISNKDFNSQDYGSFLKINQRSTPKVDLALDEMTMRNEIVHGNINYFDVEFASKVIFRNGYSFVLGDGAHQLDNLPTDQEYKFPDDVFKVAHLPLLSRERLDLRAEQGKKLIQDGFPEWHGWQSQMVYEIQKDGKLDDFWIMHSVNTEKSGKSGALYTSEHDETFANAIEPTIKRLEIALEKDSSASVNFKVIDEYLELYDFLERDGILAHANNLSQSAAVDRNAAVAERNAAVAERNSAVAEAMTIRDARVAERNSAVAERNSAVAAANADRDAAVAERNSAVAEAMNIRDAGVAERNSAVAERNSAVAAANADRDAAVAERNSAVAERNSAVAERNSAVAAANADRDAAVAERNSAVAERNSAVAAANADRDAAVAERNSAVAERNSAVAVANAAVAERNSAVAAANADRDAAVAERNSAVAAANADRDAAVAERNAIVNSTIWKLFKPYRAILKLIKRS